MKKSQEKNEKQAKMSELKKLHDNINDIKKELNIDIDLQNYYSSSYFGKDIDEKTIEIWYALEFFEEIDWQEEKRERIK